MTHVTIIGAGNMGQAIAGLVTKGGSTIELLGQPDKGKPVNGEVVILAVPYAALAEVLGAYGDQLDGKVVVDITNPVNVETFDALAVPADSSATAEIAAALPHAKIVKAFNTTFAATLASGTVGGHPTTVLMAGDHADAKSLLADLITAGGLRAIDAGDLRRARDLEALGFLQISLAAQEKLPWTGGFAVTA